MKLVLPMPFSPRTPIVCFLNRLPDSAFKLNWPMSLEKLFQVTGIPSSTVFLKDCKSNLIFLSLNRMFSFFK